jgi:winged helix DNA-binding protein
MRATTRADVAVERMTRQGLVDRPAESVADAARLGGGLQAQDPQASRLGVRARSAHRTEADVLRAIDQRAVVRTWLMRATIHLVAADDVVWMTRLLGPAIARKFAKRWTDLGLTPHLLDRTAAALPEVLADGPLTRRQIATALAERGVHLPGDDQAPTHMLMQATTLGLVCRGPDRGRDSTFTTLSDWVPDAPEGPSGDEALAELARRYFRAFSPATAADFTTWSGLPSARAIALIRDELTPADVNGRDGYRLGEVEPQRGLRLLPAFDNYLVGYRDRALIIDERERAEVYIGGIIRPTVLLDGRVIGTWRVIRRPDAATVAISPFAGMAGQARTAIEAEVDDIARFLAVQTTSLAITEGASR